MPPGVLVFAPLTVTVPASTKSDVHDSMTRHVTGVVVCGNREESKTVMET